MNKRADSICVFWLYTKYIHCKKHMVMMTMSLESLPNEVWLLFMCFLAPIDLYRALAGLNYRIDDVLISMIPRPMLDTSQCGSNRICFSDLRQVIEGKHYWSKRLRLAIDSVCLTGTLASNALRDQLQCPVMESSIDTSFSTLFPSLCRLYITEEAIDHINVLQMVLPMKNSAFVTFT